MDKRRCYTCLVGDGLLFAFAAFGVTATLCNWHFMADLGRLTETPFLYTFTGLSNLLMGVVALLCFIVRIKRHDAKLPVWASVIRMVFTSNIAITFLITAAYLAPSVGAQWWRLYINANLFNHLLTPLWAIFTFLVIEPKTELKFKHTFFALIPMGVYGVFYFIRAYSHIDASGRIDLYYDIYGLARFGVGMTILFLFGFLLLAWGITAILYLLNTHKKGNL